MIETSGAVRSILTITEPLADIPALLVALQVKVVPETVVSTETVTVPQPVLEAIPEIGSVTLQLRVAGCECHPHSRRDSANQRTRPSLGLLNLLKFRTCALAWTVGRRELVPLRALRTGW